jgi:transposase-like protein
LGNPGIRRWEDNIKIDQDISCEGVDLNHLVQERVQDRHLRTYNSIKGREFPYYLSDFFFSSRVLMHGVSYKLEFKCLLTST